MSVFADDGSTWSPLPPVGNFVGIVVSSDVVRLNNGRDAAFFHDGDRLFAPEPRKERRFQV